MRVLFCGTPSFAIPSLEALNQDPDFDIISVVTQPDRPSGRGKKLQPSPVKQSAQALGLKVISPSNINSTDSMQELRSLDCDLAIVIAYGQILKQDFLDLFPKGSYNLHGSLLPRWRGAAPIQRALMAGDSLSGLSLQKIVLKLDAGDVVAETKIALDTNINAVELFEKLSLEGPRLVCQKLKSFLKGQLTETPQDESLVTYAHKLKKEESLICWNKTPQEIHNHVRGLAAGPHAFTKYNQQKIKIYKSRIISIPFAEEIEITNQAPGTIVAKSENGFLVACHADLMPNVSSENIAKIIEIIELQPPSKKRMSAKDFLRGQYMNIGDQFHA